MWRSAAILLFILAAGPAPAQTTWQQGGAGTWQPVPGSPRPVQSGAAPSAGLGVVPLNGNNLSPDLANNYQRLRQRRQLNERVESGSALIMQGTIPRGSR